MEYLDLDLNLTDKDRAIRQSAHEFAKEVMRPIAKQLDEMKPEEAIAPGSPYWDFLKQAYELGYHKFGLPEQYSGMNTSLLQTMLIVEELAWGSAGLAVALGVAGMPAQLAALAPNDDLVKNIIVPFCECRDGSMRGCWGITEPDHGSDTLMPGYPSFRDPKIEANCRARLDGNEWVINGQKSSWVSCGTVSTHCLLYCQIDSSMGHAGSGIFIVPADRPGVSKGKPLNKLGQRDENQGEIFFDEVRIPKSYQICGPEAYEAFLEGTLAGTMCMMGIIGTAIGRAAYEESLAYAKKRVQGGRTLIDYTHVKMTLFNMLRRVEASRYLTRNAFIYNQTVAPPALEYSQMSKIQGTETAFKNTHEAIQIFGGNGLAKEFLIEKLFRDARATLIEDGSNQIIAIAGGHTLAETYPRRK
ncbi:MAG: acyl-CoA/acyl-ACP dehydrogenase [Deltaproteobacteria bacterium]|nr:acyl-CoA/acyl-ACP dehydrogenase [Deltaproteobacteria bacterium]